MADFTVVHRAVPIGTIRTRPGDDGERIRAFRQDPWVPLTFSFVDFSPNSAYSGLASQFQVAARAFANYGFLGPAAHPASDASGSAAIAEAEVLWAEFELVDDREHPVSGRVVWFLDNPTWETRFWVTIELDDAPAAVPAPIEAPPIQEPSSASAA